MHIFDTWTGLEVIGHLAEPVVRDPNGKVVGTLVRLGTTATVQLRYDPTRRRAAWQGYWGPADPAPLFTWHVDECGR